MGQNQEEVNWFELKNHFEQIFAFKNFFDKTETCVIQKQIIKVE